MIEVRLQIAEMDGCPVYIADRDPTGVRFSFRRCRSNSATVVVGGFLMARCRSACDHIGINLYVICFDMAIWDDILFDILFAVLFVPVGFKAQ